MLYALSLPSTRTRRNTGCVMLLVWLFAMASRAVNVCLLEPPGVQDHASPLPQLSAADTTAGMSEVTAEGLTHDHDDADSGPIKASCLKACDEGCHALLKHPSSFDWAQPGLAPLVAAVWAAAAHLAPAFGQAHDFQLPERGPLIRVRFSRLLL